VAIKLRNTRKGLKGWSANIESAQRKLKQGLVAEYDLLDILSELKFYHQLLKKE
jgi:hypothetical protein